MPISLRCTHCGARLEAPDSTAGKTKSCPKCGEPIVIPSGAAAESAPPADGAPPAPDTPPEVSPEPAEPEDDAAEHPAEEESSDLGAYYAGQAGGASSLRWLLAFIFFVIGVGFCVFIIARSGTDGAGVLSTRPISNMKQFCAETYELYVEAGAKAKEGKKKEAIKLYQQVLECLERLPPDTAANMGLDLIRDDLETLKASPATDQPPSSPNEAK